MAKPEIRLKGFKGEWKETTIGNVSNSFDYGINAAAMPYDGINKYLRITDIDDSSHLFNQTGLTSPQSGNINLDSYLLEEGDITFARTGASVGKSYIYDKNDGKVIFAGFLIRTKIKNEVNPHFVFMNSLTKRYEKYIKLISQRSGQPGMNTKELSDFSFLIPSDKKEQKAIVDYFKSLDSMILGVTKKIASLKQMKQACLVSMFPQAGETTPRVRFKGFKGEWENVSFKDITYLSGTKNKDNLPLESYSISNEKGFVPQNEQFEQGGTMSNADKRLYYIVTPDSFAYNPARINVGSIGYDDLDKDVIVSSLYVVFKTDDKTNNYFLNHWFKTPMFRNMIELYQEGGVRLYFFYDKLCQCHIRRPCLAEQEKIASFFTSLDKQISLQEARLEKLKQIKSACLDKMFV